MTIAPRAAESSASSAAAASLARFIFYVAGVLTLVRVLFPPFTSLNGTEYAFVATGPEWSRATGGRGAEGHHGGGEAERQPYVGAGSTSKATDGSRDGAMAEDVMAPSRVGS